MTTKTTAATTTTATKIDPRLHTRAMLVSLTIRSWSARRYDKTVTQKINREHSATTDAGRYNKNLLPGDAPSYKALTTLLGTIRGEHYSKTLAWSDEAWRLLTTMNYMDYSDWYRKRQQDIAIAVDAFKAEYPVLKERAKHLLNGLYDESDYPSVVDIGARFGMKMTPMPLPADGDIRLELAADHVEYIENEVRASVQSSLQNAMNDAWSRLGDVVEKIEERLSDPDAIFRDSLIGNARDVCDVLKRLNVTNDPELERMRSAVESKLTKYEPEGLRDFPHARKTVAKDAKAILEEMRKNGVI